MTASPAEGPNSHLRRELVLAAREYARASDALLVSDYGYGAATPTLLNVIREKRGLDKVPVTLDSRHRMLEFSGVTAATPNESEVEEVLGIRIGNDWERLLAAGDQIAGEMNLEVAADHARQGWHGGFPAPPQAGGYSDLWQR